MWLAVLLHIREILGSNLDLETGHTDIFHGFQGAKKKSGMTP
jgi:hypothetical protein